MLVIACARYTLQLPATAFMSKTFSADGLPQTARESNLIIGEPIPHGTAGSVSSSDQCLPGHVGPLMYANQRPAASLIYEITSNLHCVCRRSRTAPSRAGNTTVVAVRSKKPEKFKTKVILASSIVFLFPLTSSSPFSPSQVCMFWLSEAGCPYGEKCLYGTTRGGAKRDVSTLT